MFSKLWGIAFFSVFFSLHALAGVTCQSFDQVINLPANILYLSGLESNSLISATTWHELDNRLTLDCATDMPGTVETFTWAVAQDSGKRFSYLGQMYTIFRSEDPRIGIIAEINQRGVMIPLTTMEQVNVERDVAAQKFTFGLITRVRLVAMEKLPPGLIVFTGIKRLTAQSVRLRGVPGFPTPSMGAVSGTTIQGKNTSCMLDAPAAVKLVTTNMSAMKGVGDTAGDVPFNMSVSCDATDVPYISYAVNFAMSDVNDPGNTSTALSPGKASGAALGIGIQVVDEGEAINFSGSSGGGKKRTFGRMAATGGTLTKTLRARYVRTAAYVAPGKINAAATVVISYK